MWELCGTPCLVKCLGQCVEWIFSFWNRAKRACGPWERNVCAQGFKGYSSEIWTWNWNECDHNAARNTVNPNYMYILIKLVLLISMFAMTHCTLFNNPPYTGIRQMIKNDVTGCRTRTGRQGIKYIQVKRWEGRGKFCFNIRTKSTPEAGIWDCRPQGSAARQATYFFKLMSDQLNAEECNIWRFWRRARLRRGVRGCSVECNNCTGEPLWC